MRNNINFGIFETCSFISTDNEPITVILKDSQISTRISTIYIPLTSLRNKTILSNIENSADNVIITGDLNVKHTDFNCTKMGQWDIAMKKALYGTDLFIAENNIPTHRK